MFIITSWTNYIDILSKELSNHLDNVCFGTPYFFDMNADDSPFSTSFSVLYFSEIVMVLSFLLQPATFDILAYNTKQQSQFSNVRSFESY